MDCIQSKNYKKILKDCYSQDKELIEKWHIYSGKGLSACINKTYNDLKLFGVKFYKLEVNKELVGYFGVEEDSFLTGFFIAPKFRNKIIVNEFWNIVNSKFNNNIFSAGVFKKNKRAINFLMKNNGKIVNEFNVDEGEAVLIAFNLDK